MYVTNNPEVSEAFYNEEVRFFLRRLLEELEDPHTLKDFLIDGHEKTYDDIIKQLSKSFKPIEENPNEKNSFISVLRCIDGATFKIGDMVVDKTDDNGNRYPISRMYEDDRGLHIKLDVDNYGTLTWRDLSRIDHN